MKIPPIKIPGSYNKAVIIKEDLLSHSHPSFHRNDEIRITFVQKGEGTLLIGNSIYPFGVDEVYVIVANTHNILASDSSCCSHEADRIQSITIFFNLRGQLSSFFELPEFENMKSFLSHFDLHFKIPQHDFDEISGKILSIDLLSGEDRLIALSQLLKSLGNISGIGLTGNGIIESEQEHTGEVKRTRMNDIYKYIKEHYSRNITLEEVAGAVSMTPEVFCRYLKMQTRLTFVSFLNQIRVSEAQKKLLDGTHKSVSSVAYNCGFNSINNFNRVFKTSTGKSPSEYLTQFISHGNR